MRGTASRNGHLPAPAGSRTGSTLGFFRLWTLKEALLKAIGAGFTCSPQRLCWEGLDDPDAATALFEGRRRLGLGRCFGAIALATAVRDDGQAVVARWLPVA